jgi:purine nucleosidase
MEKVIIDSDWGSDGLQLSSILLARPEHYTVLGATVTFGNAPHDQNLINAGALLRQLGIDHSVPRFAGANAPSGQIEAPDGDGAHGSTGMGNVQLPPSLAPVDERSAVDFILQTLEREAVGTVTLIATAPQTNIANAIRKAPDIMRKLKEIRIMGGCTESMLGYRVDAALNRLSDELIPRKGNITEWAEFNFQQAPEDAECVLKSGIPIRLFPMNCTHQMCFTKQRIDQLKAHFATEAELVAQLIPMLSIPEYIDRQKFDIAPTLHDVHTTIEMVHPEFYASRRGFVQIATNPTEDNFGETCFREDPDGPHTVFETILQPDAAFQVLLNALSDTLCRPLSHEKARIAARSASGVVMA